jgi:hypothetical protein
LIHVILRRRGLAPSVVPPISLVLATWSDDYVDGLTRARYRGSPQEPDAVDGSNAWISLFAGACRRAVADAEAYEARVRAVQDAWRERLGRVRKDSAGAFKAAGPDGSSRAAGDSMRLACVPLRRGEASVRTARPRRAGTHASSGTVQRLSAEVAALTRGLERYDAGETDASLSTLCPQLLKVDPILRRPAPRFIVRTASLSGTVRS